MSATITPLRPDLMRDLQASLAAARADQLVRAIADKARQLEQDCAAAQQAIDDLLEQCRRYQPHDDAPTGAITR